MTTSNPPTAVEALIQLLESKMQLDEDGMWPEVVLDCKTTSAILQALQLHGGGESRSDFASGSGGPTWDRVRALVSNARYSGISTIAEKNALLDSTTDQILALLNPTSPWRPIESAPENGTQIMVEYDDGQRVKVYWGCYDNGYSQSGVEGWVMGLSGKHPVRWMPLPALPGGSE